MNILVCVKLVPDVSKMKIDKETNNLIREGVRQIINPADLSALRFALDLKDANDGHLTVLSMGPPDAEDALRTCIEMGADDGYLISGIEFKGSDTLATSYTLAEAIKKIGDFDIVFTGDKSLDGDTGQIGPELAEMLGFNLVSYVQAVDYQEGEFFIERKTLKGTEEVKTKAPVLLSALRDSAPRPSRFARNRMAIAKEAEIKIFNGKNLDLDPHRIGQEGSPTYVKDVFPPSKEEPGHMIEGKDTEELVDKIIHLLVEKNVIR
ncbi:MAG: electron transfer flavoprotein subunit beta/FixA family protein [Tissierellia bacterium]|nr:electron transfer flavoprotein subunit beta/FixA family protein [Tissierellia bacterium]